MLIQLSDFADYEILPPGAETVKRLDPCIREAENIDMIPLIGQDLLTYLRVNVGASPAEPLADALLVWLKPVLVYYSFARFIRKQQIAVTQHGTVQKKTDVSEPASESSVKAAITRAESDALAYWFKAKEFLEDNDADYPDWQSFCSKSSVTINSIRITHVRKKW